MKRLCMACDLKNQPQLIEKYLEYHKPGGVWPEIITSIKHSGVLDMEIYLQGDRLLLIMEVDDDFDLEHKAQLDQQNPRVVEWEQLMWQFQKAVPGAPEDQKWTSMELIFKLP